MEDQIKERAQAGREAWLLGPERTLSCVLAAQQAPASEGKQPSLGAKDRGGVAPVPEQSMRCQSFEEAERLRWRSWEETEQEALYHRRFLEMIHRSLEEEKKGLGK